MSEITIVDYGLGNLGSIVNMLKRIGVRAMVTDRTSDLETAEKLVLPGVGVFDRGMTNLEERGMLEILNRRVLTEGIPVLGICLGMQLMAEASEEGLRQGLGWIPGKIRRFSFSDRDVSLPVPHMGWNTVLPERNHPLFRDLDSQARFYFVHSFHYVPEDPDDVLCRTEYGGSFVSAVARGAILGVQFHPEKSHRFGMTLLSNFARFASC